MKNQPKTIVYTPSGRPGESGVALITVLALLSIFAVVLVGFTYTIRMEEFTIQNYAETVNVNEASEAAIQGVLAQLARDLDPTNTHTVLGRPQPRYTSLLDPWALGYSGKIGNNLVFDARSHILDNRPESVVSRRGLTYVPNPLPLGIDEDPPGDVTGRPLSQTGGRGGDGAPGLRGIDDDLDGQVDVGGGSDVGQGALDDDEDFRIDEDGYDPRRPDRQGQVPFTPGTGYDNDNDRRGVYDESAKININVAGNNFGRGGSHSYNLGVGPWELDLPVFLYNRVVNYRGMNGSNTTFSQNDAEQLTRYMVNFRYGATLDAGQSLKMPGADRVDDNNNGNPEIVKVQKYNEAANVGSNYPGEPFAVVGNEMTDDDGDGLFNEEDEVYVGPTTENSSGTPITGPVSSKGTNLIQFRPGDKIDNDADGIIDERDEGMDDPTEFNVARPVADDRPYGSVSDLHLVQGMTGTPVSPQPGQLLLPTLLEILTQSTTIYSQSDQVAGPLSGANNEVGRVNPNSVSNWKAVDMWNELRSTNIRADFQYSTPVRIEDLLSLQVDLDGDWQLYAEPDVAQGEGNGKDDDGDGLIDEPSDDYDKNMYPSGDFDGYGEPDVGSQYTSDGPDSDLDGFATDDAIGGQDIIGNLRRLPADANDYANRPHDEQEREILPGVVVEGNGQDDDGDGIIDDTGDFNGDGYYAYDPEWHVSEDAWGDTNGDGYPGLGADPDANGNTAENDIVRRPDTNHDLLVTSFADDDWDGYADFYDPQVLAAMYAPEMDGVDNDSDGEVDEIGERYIACFDDDEDGRMDEDPPQFQLALNLIDFIDSWAPTSPAQDPDVIAALGVSEDDAILSDPVTSRTFTLSSSRQRAFRWHSRLLSGPNSTSTDEDIFGEYMRMLLPNPPQVGMSVKFSGVEAIRINEVFAKPMIRLEAEEVLERVDIDPANPSLAVITPSNRFTVNSGGGDDGALTVGGLYDSNWGNIVNQPAAGTAPGVIPSNGFHALPEGIRHTLNPFLPLVNLDSLAPAFIFGVTNEVPNPDTAIKVGSQAESATWRYEGIPNGVYDIVIYMHPNDEYNPNVHYSFNNQEIPMISEAAGHLLSGAAITPFVRSMGRFRNGINQQLFDLNYRLLPATPPLPDDASDTASRVVIDNGQLEVTITADIPAAPPAPYSTSFDRIELINPRIQYVELVNLSTEDIDLTGFGINTPYGHYVITDDDRRPVIKRMKPAWKGDRGDDLNAGEGITGTGVPFENLLEDPAQVGGTLSQQDRDVEDNKLLLAFDKASLIQYINRNFPPISDIQDRVIQPEMSTLEAAKIVGDLQNPSRPGANPYVQQSDLRFRVVDVQDDILSHNPEDKFITLTDPAGNTLDVFKYRTTFNNTLVDVIGNNNGFDVVALPGYRGFETFERTDPTYFKTEMKTVPDPAAGTSVDALSGQRAPDDYIVNGERSTPSSIELSVQDAILGRITMRSDGALDRTGYGGYNTNDRNNPNLTRYKEPNPIFGEADANWGGWDFIGDFYRYPSDLGNLAGIATLWERTNATAREAVTPSGSPLLNRQKTRFYQNLGGFENHTDVTPAQLAAARRNLTSFTWRIGLRELIRSGYDPEVDDQLTVRVLGRKYVESTGQIQELDLPVGEVMVIPSYRVVDPGKADLHETQQTAINENNIYNFGGSSNDREPVFAKLRNGDTAFTIDLRDQFTELQNDLRNSGSAAEPMIEITVVMRKTTRDISPNNRLFNGQAFDPIGAGASFNNRLDLTVLSGVATSAQTGYYASSAGTMGGYGDDNYFFRGIELFGRGRVGNNDNADDNERRSLLAGTPGRDNTGYVPAYPRRRLELAGNSRDMLDIIDNTAYVKNGPLATLGELSRLYTGNKFETVNSPIIPQRVEDKTRDSNRPLPNAQLAQRASSDDIYRIQLAQRERLDQWENQYTPLYNMITTSVDGIIPGLININTAPREVLAALPATPPKDDGTLEEITERHFFNTLVADFIIEGRYPGGRDQYFGVHEVDDDIAVADITGRNTRVDTQADYKLPSVGRPSTAFKEFDRISSEIFNPLGVAIEDIKGQLLNNLRDVSLSTIVSEPDDGPYSDIATLLAQISHLKRRERFSEFVNRSMDRTGDGKVDGIGDLRERLNLELGRDLTPEEMEALMNRVSNLITVRSRAFSIITRGRIFDKDGNISAQRRLETVYQR